ncbi:MAG TPA: hypothetical protein VLT82_13955 [Myxococcaceae bacterium]|nr:hypothetical protein [Myxococcaceae bacterium]
MIPLAAALGCAGSQQEQRVAKADGSSTRADGKAGNSTLIDEGPGSAGGQGAATAQAGAAQLVPFQGANGYTVLMPANPERNDRTEETPGGPVQVHIAQIQDPSGKYMSSLSEFPGGSLDKMKSRDLLDSLQQATVQSMGGTLVNSRDIDVAGLPGREFTATDPEGSQVTARVFVGGSNVYTLAGTYPKGQMPGPVQQFLGSFQPPAGTAVGGSGAPDSTTDGAPADSISDGAADSSVTPVPAQPPKRKKARSSSSSSSTQSTTGIGSGSR